MAQQNIQTDYKSNVQFTNGVKYLLRPLTWAQVKQIIADNALDCFARSKEQTEKYRKAKQALQETGRSLYKRLICVQLKWADASIFDDPSISESELDIKPCSSQLFHDPRDVKIILNDFPYDFEEGITHLLAWTKVPILGDPSLPNHDISLKTREKIDLYVYKTMVEGLGVDRENVVWFRNWSGLQSVPQLSHIHILVKDLSNEQLSRVLNTPGVLI